MTDAELSLEAISCVIILQHVLVPEPANKLFPGQLRNCNFGLTGHKSADTTALTHRTHTHGFILPVHQGTKVLTGHTGGSP